MLSHFFPCRVSNDLIDPENRLEAAPIHPERTAETVAAKAGATIVDVSQFPGGIKGTEGGYIPLMDYLVNFQPGLLEPGAGERNVADAQQIAHAITDRLTGLYNRFFFDLELARTTAKAGQRFELAIDTSTASQRFTTDCEVCCRPFEVIAECEPGEVLSLVAGSGS